MRSVAASPEQGSMILDSVLGFVSKDLGIDLGTANTLVVARGEGIILSEPSVVAVYRGTHNIVSNGKGPAVGESARRMLGRTPGSIEAIRPLKNGVIADIDITEAMLSYFIGKAHGRGHFVRPRIVIAVPSGINTVEKRAVIQAAVKAGAREVRLVREPMAAALGVGLPITEPRGSLILDIGGGTSEVAVISLSDIVESTSLPIAGDALNDDIMKYMKQVYNLRIGPLTAERIKIEIGSAYRLDEELTKDVSGTDTVAGLPRTVTVRSEEIREALADSLGRILRALRSTLEKTPPELAADLVENGITIAGGGALLRGLDRLIARETALPVRRAEDPLTAVARGTGAILDNFDYYWQHLEDAHDVG